MIGKVPFDELKKMDDKYDSSLNLTGSESSPSVGLHQSQYAHLDLDSFLFRQHGPQLLRRRRGLYRTVKLSSSFHG